MPPISKEKKNKIKEQILHYLFSISPESAFTSKIAEEIARDEEFVKSLLLELKLSTLITEVTKNSQGIVYTKRQRWRLSSNTYEAYKNSQNHSLLSADYFPT